MRLFYTSIIGLTSLLILTACSTDQDTADTQQTPYVLTAQVESGFFEQWTLVGRVESQHQATLGFQVSGMVEERLVSPGDQVQANQVLLKLDPSDLKLKLRAAQANLKATAAEFKLAKIEAKRSEDLLARKLVSQQDYDRAQNQVTTLQQRHFSLQSELDLTERQLAYTELKTIAPGLVQKVNLDKGDLAQVGQAAIELIYTNGLDVLVEVPANRIQILPKTAHAKLNDQPTPIEVSLREVTPKTQGSAQTWQARYHLPLTFDQIQLGQTATLTFGQQLPLLKVPLSAVFELAEGPQVWIIQDQQVQAQPVKIIQLTSEYALIEGNLTAGDRVIRAGVHLLKPGQTVKERGL